MIDLLFERFSSSFFFYEYVAYCVEKSTINIISARSTVSFSPLNCSSYIRVYFEVCVVRNVFFYGFLDFIKLRTTAVSTWTLNLMCIFVL